MQAGHSISWSLQPHKKSINFGIFKKLGDQHGPPNLPPASALEPISSPSTPALESSTGGKGPKGAPKVHDGTRTIEKLAMHGLKAVAWTGTCEADKVSMGRYDVLEGEGGMYGLVFDNTFSKQTGKMVTFVLMTHPTNAPPKSGHHLHFSQAMSGASTPGIGVRPSPQMRATSDSTESFHHPERLVLADPRPTSAQATELKTPSGSSFYTGVLMKKRRKRNQGFARRFFSLDFTTGTLSYYHNRNSSALRGAIPLSLAAIGTNEKSREISIDSGAEIWHLKAQNKRDFEGWQSALEKASMSTAVHLPASDQATNEGFPFPATPQVNATDARDWAKVESLVGRVGGTRDAVRRLAKDTDPKYLPGLDGLQIVRDSTSATPSPTEAPSGDYFLSGSDKQKENMPFWKRKPSNSNTSQAGIFRRSVSAQVGMAAPSSVPPPPNGGLNVQKPRQRQYSGSEPSQESMHEHCMAILRDLDAVVAEFSELIAETKQRRAVAQRPALGSRPSFESSLSNQEFFDAEDGDRSGFLTIRPDSDEGERRTEDVSDGESESDSEVGGIGAFDRTTKPGVPSDLPTKPKSLTPLPLQTVKRRVTIQPPKGAPPSLIGFLRKNVGKDLSTVAMPVTANEPTSLLQRISEVMEYSELLDAASAAANEDGLRLLHVAAFAIASFSNNRVKERAIRKPFNPMLGETFELVREDKGFRFLAEKVSHRPVRIACQAESEKWTFWQAPMPLQKFWGKSAEINTDGKARVVFHETGEHYSWTIATSFLRNIIAGEKYVEPVGSMTIIDETNGANAVATFKAGGMFSGRSEEVTVQALDSSGAAYALGLAGSWTQHLRLTKNGSDTGKDIWTAGPLVADAAKHYGFTTFAASLNEVTPIEEDHLPPTDSRLRPDQIALEEGQVDKAEALKARLEERQRARRRVMEDHGEQWTPRWFAKTNTGDQGNAEEVWRLVSGNEGYWEQRESGHWTGVTDIFQV